MHRKGGDQERIRRVLLGETASQERARVHAQVRECWPETSYIYTRAVCCGETSNFNNTNQRGKTSGKKTPNMHQNNPLKKNSGQFFKPVCSQQRGESANAQRCINGKVSTRSGQRHHIRRVCLPRSGQSVWKYIQEECYLTLSSTTYLVPGTVFIILLYDVFHRRR